MPGLRQIPIVEALSLALDGLPLQDAEAKLRELGELRVKHTGKKSPIADAKKLIGKVPPEEVTAVRDYFRAMPPTADVRRLEPEARRARGARHLWDLVAYLESL